MEELNIEEYQDPSCFTRLSEYWDSILANSEVNTIFLTRQWQSLWWHHFGKGKSLRLFALRADNGEYLGLAPLYSEQAEGKALQFIGGRDLCDYLDFIVTKGREEEVLKAFLYHLSGADDHFTYLNLNSLPEDSPTLRILRSLGGEAGLRIEVSVEDTSPLIILSRSFEDYLGGLDKKDRHEIRRKVRRAQAGGELEFARIESEKELKEGFNTFVNLHRKSSSEKAKFMDRQKVGFFRDITRELFKQGWLDLFFLKLRGREVASLFCFNYQRRLYLYNSGYDPEYSSYSPGIVLLNYCIADAIGRGIKEFDLLRGNESYKYHFGARDRSIYQVTVEFSEKN